VHTRAAWTGVSPSGCRFGQAAAGSVQLE